MGFDEIKEKAEDIVGGIKEKAEDAIEAIKDKFDGDDSPAQDAEDIADDVTE